MKKPVIIVALSLILCLFRPVETDGGTTAGIPFVRSYTSKEYNQHEQNWAAVQDSNGLMYFGNTHGLLEYDGSAWDFYRTPGPNIVRSLAVTDSNRLYVGGYNYFGHMSRDSSGCFVFQSLSDLLKPGAATFGNVWNILIGDAQVYFQTDSALFRWDNNTFKSWKTSYPFNRSFLIRDTVYTVTPGTGLVWLDRDIFKPVDGGERFTDEKIFDMVPWNDHDILIGTRKQGLLLYSGNAVRKFKTDHDNIVSSSRITALCPLPDGTLAVATRNAGALIFNEAGKLEHWLKVGHGLPDNTVWQLFADNQGGLWLMLNNGLVRVQMASPVTRIDARYGLEGTVESIGRLEDKLYIATSRGLFFMNLDSTTGDLQRFGSIKPWRLYSAGTFLVVSGYDGGTWILNRKGLTKIMDESGYSFRRSALDSNRIFIGLESGLASIYWNRGHWREESDIDLGITPVRDIVETRSGELWLGTSSSAVCRIRFPRNNKGLSEAEYSVYDEESGLIPSMQTYVFSFRNRVLFGNGNRILAYHEENDRFFPFDTLNSIFENDPGFIQEMVADQRGRYWLYGAGTAGMFVGVATGKENGWVWHTTPYKMLEGDVFTTIYPDPVLTNTVWLGGPDGLVRYHTDNEKTGDYAYHCLIRQVKTNNDSILWDHRSASAGQTAHIRLWEPLKYSTNQLRIEYTAPFYEMEGAIRFKYMLDDFDQEWSQWSEESIAHYTNIPEGTYRFRVIAKNLYDKQSREASFAFEILPPWYRTWPVYVFYLLMLVALIVVIVRLRLRTIEAEKKKLEQIVLDRTEEIQQKNRQLEEQAKKLIDLDETKSRFFADVSHEFRTPLTLIKGPAEEVLNNTYHGSTEKALKMILTNTDRLLLLINQLLDISKLESGSIKLKTRRQPLSPFISVVINFFSSLAESKHIKLAFIRPEEEFELYFDTDMLEKILCNLLSNAFKFTPDHGFITITVQKVDPKPETYPDGAVVIGVHDSGKGIPEEEIGSIFKRFEQGEHSLNNSLKGSGIGLALTKELVLLHHGDIEVSTAVDEGTKFDVYLPLGRQHLQADEILDEERDVNPPSEADFYIPVYHEKPQFSDQAESAGQQGNRCEIVIVEDNEEVRHYIRDHLEEEFLIAEAENGAVGEQYIIEHLPDLVVSDVMMPEMDGVEMTERLKKNPLTSHIPVILLTAKASEEARIEGLETGADAYMAKPFSAQELMVRAKKLIEGRKKLREAFKKELLLEPSESDAPSIQDMFLTKVTETIQKNLWDPDFGAERLSGSFNFSRRQFHRKVQALTGHTPGQLIRMFRLKKAKQMIEKGNGTVSEIAYEVGFNNLSYFSKCFSEQFGKLPSEIDPSHR